MSMSRELISTGLFHGYVEITKFDEILKIHNMPPEKSFSRFLTDFHEASGTEQAKLDLQPKP